MIRISVYATREGDVIQEVLGPASEVANWFAEATNSNPGSMGEFQRLGAGEAKAFVKMDTIHVG